MARICSRMSASRCRSRGRTRGSRCTTLRTPR